jgi:hypothetical protein
VTTVSAALTYGNGYYTNLCDSGTVATYYNCDPGCDPNTGSCRGENQGVVKWVCGGRWNQCLESESQWSDFEQVGSTGCGYTVQLSKFDKKCRREDGTWDSNCTLLGYMVWYSGDCRPGIQTSPMPTSLPTVRPSPTIVPTSTQAPSPTPGENNKANPTKTPTPSPSPKPAEKICGMKCAQATDCRAGFSCASGLCRNPACPEDKSCFCRGEVMATASAVTEKSPDTGWEVWAGMAGMVALGWTGIRLRRQARKLWY